MASASKSIFQISTARLNITHFDPYNPTHTSFLVTLYNNPEILATNGGVASFIPTVEAAQAHLERNQAKIEERGYGQLLVSLKPTNPTFQTDTDMIGMVSLKLRTGSPGFIAPDLGYGLLPQYHRKGYASEAARGLMEYAQRELGVKDMLAFCDDCNEGSKAVLQKLGFVNCGVHELKPFGGKKGCVWMREGMTRDLGVWES
ncbi:including n-acetylases of ribosomal protein [Delitschia confertaspora ATCC 74209]|uniref:Including n-acetylases of ribosomal protein n=1 Tax=Delitschia confertaspora ATCC 74209 TaxID=1513339 RepID=A0A9P4JUL8_9PLEO|nr:including n-acetylases of ribosomal protein [Delitschia confertaspora ATCC 74209]